MQPLDSFVRSLTRHQLTAMGVVLGPERLLAVVGARSAEDMAERLLDLEPSEIRQVAEMLTPEQLDDLNDVCAPRWRAICEEQGR